MDQEIRDRLSRQPFEPFRIHTSSGESYDVRNPQLVVAMKRQLFIAFPNGEHWVFCPLSAHQLNRIRPSGVTEGSGTADPTYDATNGCLECDPLRHRPSFIDWIWILLTVFNVILILGIVLGAC